MNKRATHSELIRREQATHALMALFAHRSSRKKYLDSVVQVIQSWSGCRCVGIRVIDQQSSIPYESFVGYSRAFWKQENWLSLKSDHCACVRAITGRPEPQDRPAMTPRGSFRCDHLTRFIQGLSPAKAKRFRGTCARAGFRSLAVVPIRYRRRTLGAIHLADEREGVIPLGMVEFLESVSPLIGEAVHRFNVEQELRRNYRELKESERQYRLLFDTAPVGIAVTDYEGRFLAANRHLAGMLGFEVEELKAVSFASHYGDMQDGERFIRQLRRDGQVRDQQLQLKHRNGQDVFALANTDLVRVAGRDVVFSTLRDITQRRQLEAQVLKAAELERQRIGRDLHDGLGQNLSGLACLCQALHQKLSRKALAEAADAAQLTQTAQEAAMTAQKLSRGLSPAEMEPQGLMAALKELAAQASQQFGVSCRFQCRAPVLVHDGVAASHLYHIAQEALNNAYKHAKPRRMAIGFEQVGQRLAMVIRNDGLPLPEKLNGQGLGIRTMNYRANAIGATLDIRRGRRGGAVVACLLPRHILAAKASRRTGRRGRNGH